MSNYRSSTLTEISKSKLANYLNLSGSDNSKCSSKCKTITSSSSSSTSSSSCKNKSRKHRSSKHKSKSSSSIYTTDLNSSNYCSTSSSSKPCKSSFSGCTTSSSSKCSSSKCSSSSTHLNSCNPYALRCNTYKSISGSVLIPGPQGPSSGSLANFSGINNSGDNINSNIYFTSENIISTNITASGSPLNTFTFNLGGRYLFQYNVNVSTTDLSIDPNQIYFLLNDSTQFGNQNITTSETYGCSIVRDMNSGDYVNLVSGLEWTFASLTIIKL
jgi:hypothetical protein